MCVHHSQQDFVNYGISLCNLFLSHKIHRVYSDKEINHWLPTINHLTCSDYGAMIEKDFPGLDHGRFTWVAENRYKYCGNSRCCKDYTKDKYGFDMDDFGETVDDDEMWVNRKVINQWYICKGCRTTYYCSKKCQKLSWNKGGHRMQCKKLRKLRKRNKTKNKNKSKN